MHIFHKFGLVGGYDEQSRRYNHGPVVELQKPVGAPLKFHWTDGNDHSFRRIGFRQLQFSLITFCAALACAFFERKEPEKTDWSLQRTGLSNGLVCYLRLVRPTDWSASVHSRLVQLTD